MEGVTVQTTGFECSGMNELLEQLNAAGIRYLLRAANRPQDQVDIEFLLELQRLGKL